MADFYLSRNTGRGLTNYYDPSLLRSNKVETVKLTFSNPFKDAPQNRFNDLANNDNRETIRKKRNLRKSTRKRMEGKVDDNQ